MTEKMEFTGRVYKTQCGEWNFFIKDSDQEEYCRGDCFEVSAKYST